MPSVIIACTITTLITTYIYIASFKVQLPQKLHCSVSYCWGYLNTGNLPGHKQSLCDKPLLLKDLSSFRERLNDPYDRARHNASMARHASNWLHALPLSTFNLKLSDEAVRVAVGLRLGSAICEPHTCV